MTKLSKETLDREEIFGLDIVIDDIFHKALQGETLDEVKEKLKKEDIKFDKHFVIALVKRLDKEEAVLAEKIYNIPDWDYRFLEYKNSIDKSINKHTNE